MPHVDRHATSVVVSGLDELESGLERVDIGHRHELQCHPRAGIRGLTGKDCEFVRPVVEVPALVAQSWTDFDLTRAEYLGRGEQIASHRVGRHSALT